MKNKEINLYKNTGILAIGTLLSKILTFFLLPLYTSYLTTESYGKVDILQTLSSLLLPIISLEISLSTFRFIIEKESIKEKKEIISTSFVFQAITIVIFITITFFLNKKVIVENIVIFDLFFTLNIVLTLIQYIVRGLGNTKVYSVMSFLNTFISLLLNIFCIVFLKMGAKSILIATILSNIITIIYAIIKLKLLQFFSIKCFKLNTLKNMLIYSMPLIPNSISWWIANVSDRFLINYFLGISLSGVYAISNKIPVIYTTIFGVYNTAWIEILSRQISDSDSIEFINEMYKKSFKFFRLYLFRNNNLYFNIF